MLAIATTRRTETEEDRRHKRERELALLLLFLSVSLDTYARQFVSGAITRETFLFYAMAVIRQSHWQAAALGVQAAGAYTFNAYTVAQRAAGAQASFVDAFARDLANGRYDAKSDGGEGAAARKRRFGLYGDRLVGTANAAWCQALGRTETLWVMGANENHCKGPESCPVEAARGWVPANQRTKTPGSGQTPCVVSCLCHLVTRDGRMSFRRGFATD